MRKGPLLSVAALALVVAGVLRLRGTGPGALVGTGLGAGLGALGCAVESVLVARALALPKGHALGILIGGFGARLVLLVGGMLLLRSTALADGTAFAFSFVGGFFAGLPLVATAARAPRALPGEGAR